MSIYQDVVLRATMKFQDHVARLQDLGDVKILEWKNKDGGSVYAIRYLFDEKNCSLTVTGDCGTLVAENFDNMTFEKVSGFFGNYEYFASKVKAMRGGPYEFDRDNALEDAAEMLRYTNPSDELFEEAIKEIEDIPTEDGKFILTNNSWDELDHVRMIDPNFWSWLPRCGKRISPAVIYIIIGLELAMKQLAC